MRLYALVEAGDPKAIDVYLCEQDARALEECLRMNLTGVGCFASRRSSSITTTPRSTSFRTRQSCRRRTWSGM